MKNLLAPWGLIQVNIQQNLFIGCQVATTQEDNYGQVVDKIELYHRTHNMNNGELSDMKEGKAIKVGRLVKYTDGSYSVFHGMIRYNLQLADVTIYK